MVKRSHCSAASTALAVRRATLTRLISVWRVNTGCNAASPNSGCKLIATGPLEPLLVRVKVSTYAAIALSVPVIFWEIWRFVTPGLKKNERRYGWVFLIAIGAILKFAVTTSVSGIELATVGVILMIVGILGLVISLLFLLQARDRGVVRERVVDRPVDDRY